MFLYAEADDEVSSMRSVLSFGLHQSNVSLQNLYGVEYVYIVVMAR